MALLSFLFSSKNKSAAIAKERLQIVIAHERYNSHKQNKNFLPELHKELITVISKYTKINAKDIKVSLDYQGNLEILDINVTITDHNNLHCNNKTYYTK